MKKYLSICIVVIFIISVCALCACNGGEEITLYVPDGAPALSVAKIIHDGKVGTQTVQTVVTTGEDVVAKCASGEADLAVLPTNAAVKICSERDDYQLFTVNVYGLLYIVGTEQISNISDLQGETLLSIGLGNTPEYVFKTICDKQSVKYEGDGAITLDYQADATTIIPQILTGKAKFALLGEPAVTQLVNKAASQDKTVSVLFDLQQLWQQTTESDEVGYPQASMIIKRDLLSKSFAKDLLEALQSNKQFLLENCDELNVMMKQAGSLLDVNYTEQIIDRCNLTVIKASEAKTDIEKYLGTFVAMKKFLPLNDSILYV